MQQLRSTAHVQSWTHKLKQRRPYKTITGGGCSGGFRWQINTLSTVSNADFTSHYRFPISPITLSMENLGVAIATSAMMAGIAERLTEYSFEIRINRRQVGTIADRCSDVGNGFRNYFDTVYGNGRCGDKQAFERMFKMQLEFIGLFKAIEILVKKYTEFNYWERFTHKRQMQADLDTFVQEIKQQWASFDHDIYHQFIAAVVERKALEAVFQQARTDDAQADAILMNHAAGTLRLYIAQGIDPALREKGDVPRCSTGEIVEKLRADEPGIHEEDSIVTKAREELLKALSQYEGICLPPGIDSAELTIIPAKPVHSGQNSDVYKGVRQGWPVANKRLRLDETHGIAIAKVLNRIDREAKIWSKFHHPNITPFFGCSRFKGQMPFLVSLWMQNGDARAYRHKHPEADVLKIVMGVASGLEYLHTFKPAPVVHGSLRGSHILLDHDLTAHLSDFGISHLLTEVYTGSRPPKYAWTAPEVLGGVDPTTESDIYSFASVAYELITDTQPFSDYERYDNVIRMKIRNGDIPSFPVEQFQELLNENCRLWKLMLRCWQLKPTKRPSIRTIVAEMGSIYEEVGP
ncbi:kinase-like domain-containing protein, partial [Lyophyllum atratum]